MRILPAFAVVTVLLAPPANAAPCDFASVKREIDTVLDQDAQRGAKFRAEVKDGWDSVMVLEKLAAPEVREQIDVCRFDVAEYLTKRGFPPAH